MGTKGRPLAVVTGASTGIGLELAKIAVGRGFDLVVAADEEEILDTAALLAASGAKVDAVVADLATTHGVDSLLGVIGARPVDALLANAGRGLGRAFLEQDWNQIRHVIDTNVTGTLYLVHHVGQRMRVKNHGRILIVGSVAGFMPGTFQAVYSGTKALLDSFAFALRAELASSGVTVTCLMPGATATEFFARADMLDAKVGMEKKASAAEVAMLGFDAMMRGDGEAIAGWNNKLRAAIAHLLPSGTLAEMHGREAAPGRAFKR